MFYFFVSVMPKSSEKIHTLRKIFFNVIFKLLLFHQYFKLLSVKYIISLSFELTFTAFMSFKKNKIKNVRVIHFLLKNSFFREVHFSRTLHVSFAQFFFVMIEDDNTYLDVFVRFPTRAKE